MPLQRNESSSQKTLNFTGMDTYVKENYNLSRERVTVFTQVSNDSDLTLKPELVFKRKSTRTYLHPPDSLKYTGFQKAHIAWNRCCTQYLIYQTDTIYSPI